MHPASDEFFFGDVDNFEEVSVGRKNDEGFTELRYVEQIEELTKIINGDKLQSVIKTIGSNWSGDDSKRFVVDFLMKINNVTSEKEKENIAKFTEGVISNDALFKSEQNKVQL